MNPLTTLQDKSAHNQVGPRTTPVRQQHQPKSRKPRVRALDDLRPYVRKGWYRIAPHANKHAICEGFTERDMVAAVLYGRELIRYLEDERLLALGFIRPSASVKIPLHVVLEYSKPRWVDVVTAFVPKDAYRVVSRTRLAELLRYDREERQAA
ncbi:MAG: DUF4258 domain-containing protein [Deinococcota bacterium]